MKKTIIIFLLGILVAVSADVAAETLMDSGMVTYSGKYTEANNIGLALDELFSAVDINNKIGDMNKISGIGNGTVTDAIATQQTQINNQNKALNYEDITSKLNLSSDAFTINTYSAYKFGNIVHVYMAVTTKQELKVGYNYTINYSINGYSVRGGILTNKTTGNENNGSSSMPMNGVVHAGAFGLTPLVYDFIVGNGAALQAFVWVY